MNYITNPTYSNEYAKFLGFAMGDGHVSGNKKIAIHATDKEMVDEFVRLGKILLSINSRVREKKISQKMKKIAYRASFNSRMLENTEIYKTIESKKIPDWIKNNDEYFINWLSSFFDCEGCVSFKLKKSGYMRHTLTIAQRNDQILKDIGIFYNKFGIEYRICEKCELGYRQIRVNKKDSILKLSKILKLTIKRKEIQLKELTGWIITWR